MATRSPSPPQDRVSLLVEVARELRLWWRLLRDGRVPAWIKTVPLVALLYVISPLDIIPDIPYLGLNQLDDLAIVVLGMKLFVALSPAELVQEIRQEIRSGRRGGAGASPASGKYTRTVEGSFRVVNPEPPSDGQPGGDAEQGTAGERR